MFTDLSVLVSVRSAKYLPCILITTYMRKHVNKNKSVLHDNLLSVGVDCRAPEVNIMENYLDDVLWVGDVTGNFSSKVPDLPYYFRFDSDSKGPVRGCR